MRYQWNMGRPLRHDLTGQAFGLLTVTGRSARRAAYPYWSCTCACGKTFETAGQNLRFGHTTSCGCDTARRASESLRGKNTTHGLTQGGHIPPEYEVWRTMLRRCQDPNHDSFPNYGGRGVTVCPRWRDFGAFFLDMGPRPGPKYTIERKNNAKGYGPTNCCWATYEEQANNKRTNRMITAYGRTQTLAHWAKESGIRSDTIKRRLALGWTPERAVSEKVRAATPSDSEV